ncbi:hypothetical protein ACHRVK_00685 [Flavobacterium plurextorum]|nr:MULTISPECIES: hypothetical protein [Flavobacterium]
MHEAKIEENDVVKNFPDKDYAAALIYEILMDFYKNICGLLTDFC